MCSIWLRFAHALRVAAEAIERNSPQAVVREASAPRAERRSPSCHSSAVGHLGIPALCASCLFRQLAAVPTDAVAIHWKPGRDAS